MRGSRSFFAEAEIAEGCSVPNNRREGSHPGGGKMAELQPEFVYDNYREGY